MLTTVKTEEKVLDKCLACRHTFERKNYWQKFCSKKCRLLYWAKCELEKIEKKD